MYERKDKKNRRYGDFESSEIIEKSPENRKRAFNKFLGEG